MSYNPSGGGGGDLTAHYVIGAADASLTNATVWPGLAAHPDTPPAIAGSLDDEFDAGSLNMTRWTWLNQGAATATLSKSRLLLTGDGSSTVMRGIYQTAPAAPWEVTAKIAPENLPQNYQFMGLIVWNTVLANGVWFGTFCSNQGVYVGQNNSYAYTNASPRNWPSYFRLRYDGTNLLFSISNDGAYWTQVYSVAATTYFTGGNLPNAVGLGVQLYSSATGAISVDWFRRTL